VSGCLSVDSGLSVGRSFVPCVCVCMCVRACVRACGCVGAWVCGCTRARPSRDSPLTTLPDLKCPRRMLEVREPEEALTLEIGRLLRERGEEQLEGT